MNIKKKISTRKGILLVAITVSIALYLAGVLSGLYASKIIKEQTTKDISSLKEETMQDIRLLQKKTEEDFSSLQGYVAFLDTNLKSMQLEQNFMETLSPGQMCNFSSISFNRILKQLSYYWSKLPYRIEEFEENNQLSEEYVTLKQQYADLSIRIWILAKDQYQRCNTKIAYGLYFYSKDCKICAKQGEQIDRLSAKILANGSDLIMFPIDISSNESIIKNLKEYYKINSTPAIIINDKLFQGRLFSAEELMKHPKRTADEIQ